MYIAIGIVGLLAFLGLGALGLMLGHFLYGKETTPHRIEYIKAPDGWRLGAEVHLPEGERKGVVMLGHGSALNHNSFDLAENHSLVRYLVQKGFEVWNVDWRGNGHSKRPHLLKQGQWLFEDHVRQDLPAFLEHITRVTGEESIHCIGHSMGGLILYAYLGKYPEDKRIASICTLGASSMLNGALPVKLFAYFARFVTLFLPRIPAVLWSRATAAFTVPPPFHMYICHPPNLHGKIFRRRLFKMTESLCRSQVKQVLLMVTQEVCISDDGEDNFLEYYQMISTPTCFIAGSIDQLAPVRLVKEVHDVIASPVKELHIMGKESGCQVDYAHEDLLIAKTAQQEVYPVIGKWLEKQLNS